MASVILFVIVLALTSAVTSGQQNAFEAHQRIAAALAAEDLMGQLAHVSPSSITTWNGYSDPVGTLSRMDGLALPDTMQMIGRDVTVVATLHTVPGIDVKVAGWTITVRAFNADGRTLAELTRFMAEPAS